MATQSSIHRLGSPIPDDGHLRWGRKGFLLSRMAAAGYSVPAGFVLPTDDCQRLMQPIWDTELDEQLAQAVTWLESVTGRQLGNPSNPLLLAVRSGAPVSLPGLLRTVLGVGAPPSSAGDPEQSTIDGRAAELLFATLPELANREQSSGNRRAALPTAAEQLRLAVRAVAASWFSASARAYRAALAIPDEPGTAILVQVWVDVDWAGVLLTRQPDSTDRTRMLVEYAAAGHRVVDGTSTPQRITLPRNPDDARLVATVGQESNPLPAHFWKALHAASLQLESEPFLARALPNEQRFDDGGLDIEWGSRGGELTLFQARPVQFGPAPAEQLESARSIPPRMLVRHGLAESLHHPTPLTWSSIRRMMSGDGALGTLYRRLGYHPARETFGGEYLELLGGNVYADPDRLARLFAGGIPLRFDRERLLTGELNLEDGPSQFDPNACGPWFLLGLPISLLRTLRAAWRTRQRLRLPPSIRHSVIQDACRWITRTQSRVQTLQSQPDDGRFLKSVLTYVLDELPVETLGWAIDADLALRKLRSEFVGHGCDTSMASLLADELVERLAEWPVSAPAALQWVAQGSLTVEQFRTEFGHRSVNEWELSAAPYRVLSDEAILAAIPSQTGTDQPTVPAMANASVSPLGIRVWQATWTPAEARQQLESRLKCSGRRLQQLLPQVQQLIRLVTGRELARDLWLRAYDLLRQTVSSLAHTHRLDQGEPPDLFFLDLSELLAIVERDTAHIAATDLTQRLAERRAAWEQELRLDVPRIVTNWEATSGDGPGTGLAERDALASVAGLSAGRAVGHVRHLRGSADADGKAWPSRPALSGTTDAGTILVCESLDTRWIPLFVQARGVITQQGGMLSHAAIVARQLGIPIVRHAQALSSFPEGCRVEIDGRAGRIHVQSERPPVADRS